MIEIVVLPITLSVEDHVCMINRYILNPFHHFTLNIDVQGFDIDVLLNRRYIGNILANIVFFQELIHAVAMNFD
jgi:hypothetical protein